MHKYSGQGLQSSGKRQRGAVLVVALIFLLLVTLIGVSSMQNATLQEKMAGSVMLKNRSFQVAEASLRLGENAVQASNFMLPPCTSNATCAPPPDATSMTLAAGPGTNGVTWVSNGDNNGFYAIQFISTKQGYANLPDACRNSSAKTPMLYRITGVGTIGVSRTVVESLYVKC